MSTVTSSEIKLHKISRVLELTFTDGAVYKLSAEFLRVYSPSAEVRGHGPGQEVLQIGKQNVEITGIEPVGSYAIKLVFSDGHDTGLYSWDYLYEIGRDHDKLWRDYLARLEQAGETRQPPTPVRSSGSAEVAPPAKKPGWKQLS
ncbi:MAG: DUF971 domain-containing protein [Betaproteobacteria bacterium]|nr:DUF971 domain-containing protein [Betaproteobacteria bacterium]